MSARGTPVRTRTRNNGLDLTTELCKRIVPLVASMYDTHSASVVDDFPAANACELAAERPPAFDSELADLRLRRRVSARASAEAEILAVMEERRRNCEIAEERSDIFEVFERETVFRPPIPRYLSRLDEEEPRHQPRKVLGMRSIGHDSRKRLDISRQPGIERVIKRGARTEEHVVDPETLS